MLKYENKIKDTYSHPIDPQNLFCRLWQLRKWNNTRTVLVRTRLFDTNLTLQQNVSKIALVYFWDFWQQSRAMRLCKQKCHKNAAAGACSSDRGTPFKLKLYLTVHPSPRSARGCPLWYLWSQALQAWLHSSNVLEEWIHQYSVRAIAFDWICIYFLSSSYLD